MYQCPALNLALQELFMKIGVSNILMYKKKNDTRVNSEIFEINLNWKENKIILFPQLWLTESKRIIHHN